MLIASTSTRLCRQLCSIPKSCHRFASNFNRRRHDANRETHDGGNRKTPTKRFIPPDTGFYKPNGLVYTAPENVHFMNRYDIEPDNGRMFRFPNDQGSRKICAKYGCSLAFSPKHVLPAHHLRFFDPYGHPEAPSYRLRYARKKKEEPLWIHLTTMTGAMSCVRHTATRGIKRAILAELEKRGYTIAIGVGPTKEIRGTLWVTVHDPKTNLQKDSEPLGKVIVDAMEEEYGRSTLQSDAGFSWGPHKTPAHRATLRR